MATIKKEIKKKGTKQSLKGNIYNGAKFNTFDLGTFLCLIDCSSEQQEIKSENNNHILFFCTEEGLWWFHRKVRNKCKEYCIITLPDDACVCVDNDGFMTTDKYILGKPQYIYNSIELFSSLLMYDKNFGTSDAYFLFNNTFYTENVWRIILAQPNRFTLDDIRVPSELQTDQFLNFILNLSPMEWSSFQLNEDELLKTFSCLYMYLSNDTLQLWRDRGLYDLIEWKIAKDKETFKFQENFFKRIDLFFN